ncbi:MAG: DNA-binding protein [Ruminococcus sp.]|nr:DNA-binding protein [Ruminococcus sp.]
MDKNLEISLLFDFYGQMLTDTQQQAVSLYYNDDLSLQETADILGMSRQGVRDALSRAKNSLYTFEENLKLYNRFSKTQQGLESIIVKAKQITQLSDDSEVVKLSEGILNEANKIYEQEV